MTVALDCANISFRYDKKKPILKGVSFQIEQGSIYGLLGPNGAGKSTLVKILSGAEIPDSGAIAIDGRTRAIASPQDALAAGGDIELVEILHDASRAGAQEEDALTVGRQGESARGACSEAVRRGVLLEERGVGH
mgnify:CR=1 FL=1